MPVDSTAIEEKKNTHTHIQYRGDCNVYSVSTYVLLLTLRLALRGVVRVLRRHVPGRVLWISSSSKYACIKNREYANDNRKSQVFRLFLRAPTVFTGPSSSAT